MSPDAEFETRPYAGRAWGVQRGSPPQADAGALVPSFRYSIPQEWGIKGVDETQPGAYQVVR